MPWVHLHIYSFLWHMGFNLALARCLERLGVYHPLAALPVKEQAVTVSHAFCPCASSSNLAVPPHSTLCILHKMCISRTARSPAHAERTCSVALLNTYHGRISASNSLLSPRSPPMKTHKGVKERERERKDSARYKDWAKSDTNTHSSSWRTERRSHFLLTCKRDWCGCLYQWVCMSCLTPLYADSTFLEFTRIV